MPADWGRNQQGEITVRGALAWPVLPSTKGGNPDGEITDVEGALLWQGELGVWGGWVAKQDWTKVTAAKQLAIPPQPLPPPQHTHTPNTTSPPSHVVDHRLDSSPTGPGGSSSLAGTCRGDIIPRPCTRDGRPQLSSIPGPCEGYWWEALRSWWQR